RSGPNDPSRWKYPSADRLRQGHRDHFVTSGTCRVTKPFAILGSAGLLMTKHIRLALIASGCLLLPGAAETQAQHFPLESTDRLHLHNVTAESATLQGKKGLQLTLPEEV